jgi:hypothetical protein
MKVILEFKDKEDALPAMQGNDWKQVVWDLDNDLRYAIKHSDEDETVRQQIRDRLHELISDYNLILE